MTTSSASKVTPNERYESEDGQIILTGVQALVRLMVIQAKLDQYRGLRTGGFVSGYRGSPLGTLDRAFQDAHKIATNRQIVVRPAVNEEIAATAIAGTQQLHQSPGARVEGVFSLWYGKGPGFDRASDAIRHGNSQGASAKGGVVVAIGDDHMAKSSTVVCASEVAAANVLLPILYPCDAAELIAYGLHGFALSRLSGSWSALKIVPEVADATHMISGDELGFSPILPTIPSSPTGLHNRWPDMPLEQEARQHLYRLPAVAAYVRANRLDKAYSRTGHAKIGIIAAGKTWLDLQEALRLLGCSDESLAANGICLYKPAMIWPLEAEGVREFGLGLQTVIVIEEKGPFLEDQVKAHLYGLAGAPAVLGKRRKDGGVLFPVIGDITPERIALELGELLFSGTGDHELRDHIAKLRATAAEVAQIGLPTTLRKPFFCSGCPHNRSTVIPVGSRALAGIGCHGLAVFHKPDHFSYAQMGGEGAQWVGMAPFTNEQHIFANMGDGTYFHSGILAIRQAVAANSNITYKLLYNSAVAMTGGQSVDGELSVNRMVDQLRAEGVSKIAILADDLARYESKDLFGGNPPEIYHRDDLQTVQQELSRGQGVSVIIFDQMCATEKRRLRKRGKLADPQTRVFINELVCEGCGDCSTQSNCLSIEPIETGNGTKRRVNQSTCNMDMSCTLGFCPSFVSVEGGKIRKSSGVSAAATALPPPSAMWPVHQRVLVAGIGGSGVVTIGALISMSAHVTGHKAGVLDQIGLAQKGGAVLSHIHIASDEISALRIPAGQADLIIACDEVVANTKEVLGAIDPGRTYVLANQDVAITSEFVSQRDATPDADLLAGRLRTRAGASRFTCYPFTRLADRLLGDSLGVNLMMVGFAYQKGWIVLDSAGLSEAIRINGAATAMNEAAFVWGRQLAYDPEYVLQAAGISAAAPRSIDEDIRRKAEFLTAYQRRTYANRFETRIARVRAREAKISNGRESLTSAIVGSLFKLMAYKDEYEVARLYTTGQFRAGLAEQFEGNPKLTFFVAPPFLSRPDKKTGVAKKMRFGSWLMGVFRILAPLKALRGTPLDVFGYTAERKTERDLLAEFERIVDLFVVELTASNYEAAVVIAKLPLEVRGYGHVKAKAVIQYREALASAMEAFRGIPAT